ncbi:MAG: hypothetical protein JW902_00785 [Syntrophaceae bacterium]|nr:hypothetical protein [Syntrophaceae bacterium]
MKNFSLTILILFMLVFASTPVVADDFDWMRDFNIQAQADPTGFRARLATRFKIGDAEISTVIGNLRDPADAYMALRLGEMSHYPPERVIDIYKANKGQGWGVMAKELGIKPGSQEFKALKNGHDFGGEYSTSRKSSNSKGNDKGKSKDRERGQKGDKGKKGGGK